LFKVIRVSAVEGSEQPPVVSLVDLPQTIVTQPFGIVGNVAELTVVSGVSGRRRNERSTVFGLLAIAEVVGVWTKKG
jgi:hypothetical protein